MDSDLPPREYLCGRPLFSGSFASRAVEHGWKTSATPLHGSFRSDSLLRCDDFQLLVLFPQYAEAASEAIKLTVHVASFPSCTR